MIKFICSKYSSSSPLLCFLLFLVMSLLWRERVPIVKCREALIRRRPCAKYFLPKQIQALCLLTQLQLEINSYVCVYTHMCHVCLCLCIHSHTHIQLSIKWQTLYLTLAVLLLQPPFSPRANKVLFNSACLNQVAPKGKRSGLPSTWSQDWRDRILLQSWLPLILD